MRLPDCARSWAPPTRPRRPKGPSVSSSRPISSATASTDRMRRKPRRPNCTFSSARPTCCRRHGRLVAAGLAGLTQLLLDETLDHIGAMLYPLRPLVFAEACRDAVRALLALVRVGDNRNNAHVGAPLRYFLGQGTGAGAAAINNQHIGIELVAGEGRPRLASRPRRIKGDLAPAQFHRESEHKAQFATQDEDCRRGHTGRY